MDKNNWISWVCQHHWGMTIEFGKYSNSLPLTTAHDPCCMGSTVHCSISTQGFWGKTGTKRTSLLEVFYHSMDWSSKIKVIFHGSQQCLGRIRLYLLISPQHANCNSMGSSTRVSWPCMLKQRLMEKNLDSQLGTATGHDAFTHWS